MGAFISYTSYDYQPHTIIPVIASFSADGHIKPLYVRINNNSYKIHSSWYHSQFNTSLEYHCQIIDNDILKPLTLTYYKNENVWGIPYVTASIDS